MASSKSAQSDDDSLVFYIQFWEVGICALLASETESTIALFKFTVASSCRPGGETASILPSSKEVHKYETRWIAALR